MEYVILVLRAIIIGVLLVSGLAKLADRDGSGEAMICFGVPPRLIPAAVFALTILEITLAIGLVFAATQPWSAFAAMVLLLVLTVAVGRVVLAGEHLECHCFEQMSSGPVSWLTLARNISLTVAAAIVWWWAQFRESTPMWDDLT